MATSYSHCVTEQSSLDVIRKEIIKVFERILSEVRARRDKLLEQVSRMKREFETKNISIVESMKELKEMRTQVEKMSIKQNLAMKKQQESLADIDSEIEKLKIDLNYNSKFKFNYSIDQLIEQVKHFGEVIDESCVITWYQSVYSKKLTAVQEITRPQNVQFSDSMELYIDYDKQLFFVLNLIRTDDRYHITVFNAQDFQFIVQFGADWIEASCIATTTEFTYVGYNKYYKYVSYRLVQYKSSDYSIVKTLNTDSPSRGIFISSENQVYVLSYSNNTFKFHIYDRALNLKEERDLCYQWPESEPTVSAKQRKGLVYILFETQLLVFTLEGKNSYSIVLDKGKLMF